MEIGRNQSQYECTHSHSLTVTHTHECYECIHCLSTAAAAAAACRILADVEVKLLVTDTTFPPLLPPFPPSAFSATHFTVE